MSALSKILVTWHTMRAYFHELLLEGCLDEDIKKQLQAKIKYHRDKLRFVKGS
ncbi:MAG TPA: hypothetical protein VNM45_17655 [Bacillus sp. (in: firmicutes)]|nr:hypothetical protein [Bacillus sp. (in: firmicutes)]